MHSHTSSPFVVYVHLVYSQPQEADRHGLPATSVLQGRHERHAASTQEDGARHRHQDAFRSHQLRQVDLPTEVSSYQADTRPDRFNSLRGLFRACSSSNYR
jgi:hypothetical protein